MNTSHRRAWRGLRAVAAVVLALALVAGVFGDALLRGAGEWLVVRDPLEPSGLVAVTLDSGAAGALEAADLVQSGVATEVAVFAEPSLPATREFARRGIAYEDRAQRQVHLLAELGVQPRVHLASRPSAGTHAEADLLAQWCREHQITSVMIITTAEHSRRMRRVMQRALGPLGVRVSVQPARFSDFDPDTWWRTNDGRRIAIVEWQKLLLDWLTHPLPASSP